MASRARLKSVRTPFDSGTAHYIADLSVENKGSSLIGGKGVVLKVSDPEGKSLGGICILGQ